ncbi:MAG: bifunctional diguanylate cyclase/phosphodiesterase, partial [Mariprofundaceae bacterium]|nr:bifunctional diguanylate cyclase/phosphodiesterase [Mariprofundaceae bacterium]
RIEHAADAGVVAEKIIATLSQPYEISDNKLYISASGGIAVYPGDGDDVETLMSHADMAMYKAKESGRNQHLFFGQQMNDAAEIRAEVEAELLVALKENQLVMFYQPVLDLRSNQITHAEALIRWQHPEKGMIPPNDFIPVAEQCGLIIPLGEWVANEVCRQTEIWRQTREDHLQVFLNVSPIQLMHANLDRHFVQAMGKYHVPAGTIGIEITENVLIEGPDKIKPVLDRLKDMGLDFLLDDFGTGFSSMRYLRKLPFDGLKIDRAFVDGVDLDYEKAVLVKAMIVMAHSLSLRVVAEGVERQEELDFLREHGCDFVQGYLLGRPMPADQFLALLQEAS